MSAESPLCGRIVVVTGAARGIGEAVARALFRRGARLALLGHEGDRLRRLADELPGAFAREVDITDHHAMTHAAEAVQERQGPPSVVVANAGIASGGPFLEDDPETWRRVIEVNLIGSSVTARVFLPALLDTRGYYLQVASLAAFAPSPMMTAYCASKAGVGAFTQALRGEVAHQGVDTGVAYLTWTDTEMIHAADQHAALRLLRNGLPWKGQKTYSPEFVAERMVYGIERRAPAVYVQRWLRAVQAGQALVPGLATWRARRVLARESPEAFRPTGLLGRGGEADLPSRQGLSGSRF
ncbi:SDR family oxidoreductase [Streptomyces sp. NPDC047108]|uniref:SDR family oxidoreductase n=1 Tax=Streptomyces sp. NPDC047108 TaxID=3155025 RepID=UPI0033E4A340